MWTTVETGSGTCLRTNIIVKFEFELNKERTIAEIELELAALALKPTYNMIQQ